MARATDSPMTHQDTINLIGFCFFGQAYWAGGICYVHDFHDENPEFPPPTLTITLIGAVLWPIWGVVDLFYIQQKPK